MLPATHCSYQYSKYSVHLVSNICMVTCITGLKENPLVVFNISLTKTKRKPYGYGHHLTSHPFLHCWQRNCIVRSVAPLFVAHALASRDYYSDLPVAPNIDVRGRVSMFQTGKRDLQYTHNYTKSVPSNKLFCWLFNNRIAFRSVSLDPVDSLPFALSSPPFFTSFRYYFITTHYRYVCTSLF